MASWFELGRCVQLELYAAGVEGTPMERRQATDFDQGLLNLFDPYVHGSIDRRGFLEARKYAVGGVPRRCCSIDSIRNSPRPNRSERRQAHQDRVLEYASPKGYGKMRGYLVMPANAAASCRASWSYTKTAA